MSARYVATFRSDRPTQGVVVDEQGGRYAGFPSVSSAERAAEKLNLLELTPDLPQLADVLVWRSIETDERLDLGHLEQEPGGSR